MYHFSITFHYYFKLSSYWFCLLIKSPERKKMSNRWITSNIPFLFIYFFKQLQVVRQLLSNSFFFCSPTWFKLLKLWRKVIKETKQAIIKSSYFSNIQTPASIQIFIHGHFYVMKTLLTLDMAFLEFTLI